MSLSDVTLPCRDCNQPFLFTVGEQAYYASRGIVNPPSRCKSCREKYKAMADQTLQCSDCNQPFTFTKGEQKFYQQHNMTAPTRCKSCREQHKAQSTISVKVSGQSRQLYAATCADCGNQTQVPFQPKPGRAIYCRACYPAHKPA